MQLDEIARERQAQSRSASPRPPPFLGLVELVEDPLQLVGRDADPLVGDVDAHAVDARAATSRRGSDVTAIVTGPPSRRELHRVREQVEEDLLQPPFVEPHASARAGSIVAVMLTLRLRGEAFHHPLDRGDGLAQVELVRAQLHLARLDLRQVEDVVDQLEQMVAGGVDVLEELVEPRESVRACSPAARSENPMIEFSGVRSSCDMLARN